MAVGDEEVLGQGSGIDGLQEALERHALAVHSAQPHTHTRLYPPMPTNLATARTTSQVRPRQTLLLTSTT